MSMMMNSLFVGNVDDPLFLCGNLVGGGGGAFCERLVIFNYHGLSFGNWSCVGVGYLYEYARLG